MDETLKYIFTFIAGVIFNAGLIYVAMRKNDIDKRNSKLAESKTMVELQEIAKCAVSAQAEAIKARDEAVAALEEYKRMRVADFEIVIVFSLHPAPTIKDVSIRSLPEPDKSRIMPSVKLVEEATRSAKKRSPVNE